MIPVSVITGFLGSGKTTLLRHLLRHPKMARTAVIINEFGEIGIDHELIETSNESFMQLTTGCLCCKVRGDLVMTLADLAARRAAGSVPPFERVVIETSGLADPAPILHALMSDQSLIADYALEKVVTVTDAVHGVHTLDRHPQSLRQAAVADCIVVSKNDLPQARTAELTSRLAALNPGATLFTATHGAVAPDALFKSGGYDSAARMLEVRTGLTEESHATGLWTPVHAHDDHITSFCLVREAPLRAVTLALLLEALADNCGADLLRVKGLVRIAEEPDRPAVIHGVQHVFHPLEWLDAWPTDDHRTRIVFIVQDIPPSWLSSLLELLEAEVADEMARHRR